MGCGSYNLQQCNAKLREPLDADQGVIGIGVLVGFIATALMTFGAIILGYLTSSLPKENLTTDLDDRIVERVASSCIGRISHKAWGKFSRISRKLQRLSPLREEDSLDDGQLQEALKKFVLTLSDQQLVTGVAILVAGFANWSTMSVYELNMVVALAWFSSATHLATLHVLQGYFQQNRVVRNWRMIGMVAIVLLLITGLLLTGFYTNNFPSASAPLSCLKCLESAIAYNCNGTYYYSTNNITSDSTFIDSGTNYTACYIDGYSTYDRDNPFSFLGRIFAVAYLIYGYSSAILQTILISPNESLTLSSALLYVSFRLTKFTSRRKKHVSIEIIQNAFLEVKAKRKAWIMSLDKVSTDLTAYKIFIDLTAHSMIFDTYLQSFVCYIGGLFFALSYGISQVVAARWAYDAPKLQAGSNRVDFGQIMALVLLVLPLLAAVEIFHENDNKRVHDIDTENETPILVTTGDSNAYNDLHNTASSENEQAHATLPNSASVPAVASSFSDPHSLASSTLTTAQTPQDSEKGLGKLIGWLFLFHIGITIAVGIILNLTTSAVISAPLVMGSILLPIFLLNLLSSAAVHKLLDTARRNNTLERYKDTARPLGEGNELPVVASGSMTRSASPVQSAFAAEVAAGGQDAVTERVVPHQAFHNSPEMGEMGEHSESLHSAVAHTTIPDLREEDVAGEDSETYVRPNRQDTESGLRGSRD